MTTTRRRKIASDDCKLCGGELRGSKLTVVATNLDGSGAKDWPVCRSCYLEMAEDEANEDPDDLA